MNSQTAIDQINACIAENNPMSVAELRALAGQVDADGGANNFFKNCYF